MSALMPQRSTDSGQFGARIGNYPGSPFRLVWVILWAIVAVWCLIGNLIQGSFGGILFGIALSAGCSAYYYYVARHPVSAQLFEHGFVITRGGKTTTARWDAVARVEHSVRTLRYDFIIPVYRSHSYRVTLSNGGRVKITSAFSKYRELGDRMHRLWTEAALDRRAHTIAQQYITDSGGHADVGQ